jgi:hypothetical protein
MLLDLCCTWWLLLAAEAMFTTRSCADSGCIHFYSHCAGTLLCLVYLMMFGSCPMRLRLQCGSVFAVLLPEHVSLQQAAAAAVTVAITGSGSCRAAAA